MIGYDITDIFDRQDFNLMFIIIIIFVA